MYKTAAPAAMPKTRRTRTECCDDPACGCGERNNYFDGKRLTPDTFRVEQRYLVERRRLLNRSIHGWGLVHGYAITVEQPRDARGAPMLRVGAGLALDQQGRELVETGATAIALDDLIAVDENGRRIEATALFDGIERSRYAKDGASALCILLSVHYAERNEGPVQVSDPCRCEQREWDRVCETVRYTIRAVPCDDCCADRACELTCDCSVEGCCAPPPREPDDPRSDDERWRTEVPPERGGCGCLCEHLTTLEIDDGCDDRLCEMEERCGQVRVDLKHGVPLACISIERDDRADCDDDWMIGPGVEACGPRRLVKRNDLLFDLIRGCDLTRIRQIGWAEWHRRADPVPFIDFSAALGPDGQRESSYLTRDFWVEFTRPVRRETVRPDCFTMTVLSVEREGGWWQAFRVPIVAVDTSVVPAHAGDPTDHVRGAKLVVDGAWIEDGVRGRRSMFLGGDTTIEIEVRGDYILDCNGQPVDANAVGLSAARTGNGSPGGTFMSGFRVAAAREAPERVDQPTYPVRPTGVTQ
ncbi:MAG TPA: hypothetical protein VGP25_22230 [Gemmatimonadaceae bacterium]|nr:hypothetical protein [Gemmatimonadaceae bacterium]